jgi:hypothetical protein
MTLRRGLTHIRIEASAKGFIGSSVMISVRYVPRRSALYATGGGGTASSATPSSGQADSGLPPGTESEAISACAGSSGGNISGCTCIFDRLVKAGFNTVAKWQAVVEDWRRSLLANGEIRFSPVMIRVALACRSQMAGQ